MAPTISIEVGPIGGVTSWQAPSVITDVINTHKTNWLGTLDTPSVAARNILRGKGMNGRRRLRENSRD